MQEKSKKLVVGAVVGGVLLVTFLIVVIIIQLAQMGVKNGQINQMKEDISHLEQLIEEGESSYEYYSTTEGLKELAWSMGYSFRK